ncbi:PDZ domain-containing protein [bacterium]|nr:PDZ domain-containing protein [bacterium]
MRSLGFIWLLIITLLTIGIAQEYENTAFMGITLSTNEEPPGFKVDNVVRNSPAEIAGLLEGDIITAVNEIPIPSRDSLLAYLKTKSPGNRLKLSLQRCGKELSKYMILGTRDDYQGIMKLGDRTGFPQVPEDIMLDWDRDSTTKLVLNAITEAKLNNEYINMRKVFRKEVENYRGFYTLNAIALPLLEPLSCFASGEWVKTTLSVSTGNPEDIWRGVPFALDADSMLSPAPARDSTIIDLDKVIDGVYAANQLIDKAFIGLTDEQLDEMSDIIPFLLDIFAQTIYIHSDPDEDLVESYNEFINNTRKIDYTSLLRSGFVLTKLYNPVTIKNLLEIQQGEGADEEKDILIDKMVRIGKAVNASGYNVDLMGRLIVSGTGSMTYTEQAAIWIDLGGDDTYLGYCGGTPYTIVDNVNHKYKEGRAGLHIDLAGNDTYIRNTPGSIGSGYCGAGCLIDMEGNDIYRGNRLSQAAAFCGVGILIDHDGDDRYTGDEAVQGFAAFGASLLYDGNGNDLYHGARYAQGVGVPKGLGMLVDATGDDEYVAAFKSPNGYGNEDTWDGWSQGAGIGFRTLAAGGIGLLCDRGGNDRYDAGNFSLACGYFFGMGIFDDLSGDDIVTGNRYTMGSGAHQAVGYFRDHAGNDIYTGHEATNQGGVWDIVSGWFIDDAGDDNYTGANISQGGASQVAMGVFIDMDGKDTYKSDGTSNGEGGATDYHPGDGGKNLGVFIDLGGNKDNYYNAGSARYNNRSIRTGDRNDPQKGDGVFWDK